MLAWEQRTWAILNEQTDLQTAPREETSSYTAGPASLSLRLRAGTAGGRGGTFLQMLGTHHCMKPPQPLPPWILGGCRSAVATLPAPLSPQGGARSWDLPVPLGLPGGASGTRSAEGQGSGMPGLWFICSCRVLSHAGATPRKGRSGGNESIASLAPKKANKVESLRI